MPKRRKNDTQEFRDGAVDLLRTSDQPRSQVARELGVSVASLRNWKNQCQGTLGREPETEARERLPQTAA